MKLIDPLDKDHGRVICFTVLEHRADLFDKAVEVEDDISAKLSWSGL